MENPARIKWGRYQAGSVTLMAEAGWSRKFDEPIPLPNGRQLVTLKEASTYITKLPGVSAKV
jgi:hypothetical protein